MPFLKSPLEKRTMVEPKNSAEPIENRVRFTSTNSDFLLIREEDTKPGVPSEKNRKRLEEKYGRKDTQPNKPGET